ncbi:MAG TPA: hypothetical protein VJ521_08300 [Acidobacteriota bacterium]|nr:hypothetical protein [Acidobacteriota bacterium]
MKDPLRDLSEELRKKLKKEITAIPLKECRFVFSRRLPLVRDRHGSNDQINGIPGDRSGT